jgi:hypothetical protein
LKVSGSACNSSGFGITTKNCKKMVTISKPPNPPIFDGNLDDKKIELIINLNSRLQ